MLGQSKVWKWTHVYGQLTLAELQKQFSGGQSDLQMTVELSDMQNTYAINKRTFIHILHHIKTKENKTAK